MIRHMRHGSPPRLMALQSILSPNRRESLPTPSAGVRMSYQGISDAAALTFMDRHGRAQWQDLARGLQHQPSSQSLTTHWHFHGCNFVRSRGTCAEPTHYPACLLPALPLRNGALNRMAYGLFLFIRDICGGDLVGWIDQQLEAVADPSTPDSLCCTGRDRWRTGPY